MITTHLKLAKNTLKRPLLISNKMIYRSKENKVIKPIEQTPKNSIQDNKSIIEVQRTPIVIKKEESSKANKIIKQSNLKYNKLSNKNTVKSAISQLLLAGEVNKACRDKILPILENCPCNNFVILFKGNTGRLVK